MPAERKVEFGAGVLESAEADERVQGDLRASVATYVVMALLGSGFMTCGIVELFTSK